MSEYTHGSMDISQHQGTYKGNLPKVVGNSRVLTCIFACTITSVSTGYGRYVLVKCALIYRNTTVICIKRFIYTWETRDPCY